MKDLDQQPGLITSQNGFTLTEVVAVMVILGILAALALPKFYDVSDSAKQGALESAVTELNSQANLSWFNNMVAGGDAGGYSGYSGWLGPDFSVTGQAMDAPGNGTIKLNGSPDTYNLVWTSDPANDSPGSFTLGTKL